MAALSQAGCAARRDTASVAPAAPGGKLFQNYCAACHQYDGDGMGDAPPLDDAPWVTGPEARLIRIVLQGVRGRIEFAGQVYDREMPGFGTILSDGEVADLSTYIRRRFGGPADPVSSETVARIRAAGAGRSGYWNAEELLSDP